MSLKLPTKENQQKCGTPLAVWIIVLVGSLNWGIIGIGNLFDANWNIINLFLGDIPFAESGVYILVGIFAIVALFGCRCKGDKKKKEVVPTPQSTENTQPSYENKSYESNHSPLTETPNEQKPPYQQKNKQY